VRLNDLVVKRATDAWVAAHKWIRRAPRRTGTVTTFTGPTADEIITAAAGGSHALFRAYETVVVERAREKLGLKARVRNPHRIASGAGVSPGCVSRFV